MDMYATASAAEVWAWSGLFWGMDKGGKIHSPEAMLPYLAQQIHNLGHVGVQSMVHRFSATWWNPKFYSYASDV